MGDSKRFFYPMPLDELLNIKVGTINQEKELEFQERRINMERDALKEEKLRVDKERAQKFLEADFDFKGEDEEVIIPKGSLPENIKFKTSNKAKKELDQAFSVVEYANMPENLKDLFNLKKAVKPSEEDAVKYLELDKARQPNLYKYSKKLKIREVEPNVNNLYDIGMKSLLTTSEITKRAELLAKLYMKRHYDEDKFAKGLEQERRLHQKKGDKNKRTTKIEDKKDDLLNGSSLFIETRKDLSVVVSPNISIPPGAKLLVSDNFPSPPPIKLPLNHIAQSQLANSPPLLPPTGIKLPSNLSMIKPSMLALGVPAMPKPGK